MLAAPCEKRFFLTERQAKAALASTKRKAESREYSPKKGHVYNKRRKMADRNRKEQRTYECDRCGFWHLTSKSLEEYREEVSSRNNKKVVK